MQLRYDLNVGALYIGLTSMPVARTREIDDNTMVDLDDAGGLVGIEVVSISHPWALASVLHDYKLPPDDRAQLLAYFRPGMLHEAPEVSMDRNAPVPV